MIDTVQGFLLVGEKSDRKRINENKAAKRVAETLNGQLCRDPLSKSYGQWMGTHWQMNSDPSDAIHKIATTVDTGCEPIGYPQRYRNAITQQIEELRLLNRPTLAKGVVPFKNGLLDIKTRELKAPKPIWATDYVLPHEYSRLAKCPNIKEWLLEAVDADEGTLELLRAFMAALILGLPVQKFLLLIGRGGTGKGTFQRLMVALAGNKNTETSTLGNIESNRFEMAKHFGKRLCLINEAGKHGGQLNMLKAMTGGDHLPLERKNQQQTGTFVYDGLVLMATNDDIASSDSGIERRRLTVRFNTVASEAQREKWRANGGEQKVLHSEIPGLINWLLDLSESEIYRLLNNPPKRVVGDNLLGMKAGNSVADWLLEECEFDPAAETEIGQFKRNDPLMGSKLYPAYRIWCEGTGRQAVAQNKFKGNVIETASTLGHDLTQRKDANTRRVLIVGVKIVEVDFGNIASVASVASSAFTSEATEATEAAF